MTPTEATHPQKICFVVMGFGKKTDFETGRILDLDASYQNMIKPAVEAAGLRCIRADEIVHSGLIDVPMYELLLGADVVVADLSTSNKNAFYELGVRHALRPFTTIIIAEDGIKTFPFDVNHVAIRQYHHLGEDIGASEARRFQKLLTDAIQQILAKNPMDQDSPVYTFLKNLTPPALQKMQDAALQAADTAGSSLLPAAVDDSASTSDVTHGALMAQASEAQKRGEWQQMKVLLEIVRTTQAQAREKARQAATVSVSQEDQENPYILQQLAWATYKSKVPTEEAALLAARDVLVPLAPATTNDTETLGMCGSIHKRLWELAERSAADTPPGSTAEAAQFLDEAIRSYERGFYLRNDYYNGINFAFLLNTRAAEPGNPAEAIADYVQAQRVRKEVLQICEQWLATHAASPASENPESEQEQKKGAAERYWVMASQGEAYLGLGLPEKADSVLQQAYALAPETWMKTSTEEQLAKLRGLLATNPLRFIAAESNL
jgi:tetratricopeptide (TPR) repeat protein